MSLKTILSAVFLWSAAALSGCNPCMAVPAAQPVNAPEPSVHWTVLVNGEARAVDIDEKTGHAMITVGSEEAVTVKYYVSDTARGISSVHVGRLSESTVYPEGTFKQCWEGDRTLYNEPLSIAPIDWEPNDCPNNVRYAVAGTVFTDLKPSESPCNFGRQNVSWQISLRAVTIDSFGKQHYTKHLIIKGI